MEILGLLGRCITNFNQFLIEWVVEIWEPIRGVVGRHIPIPLIPRALIEHEIHNLGLAIVVQVVETRDSYQPRV